MERLAGCIDKGRSLAAPTQKQVAGYVATIRNVDALLDPATGRCAKRRRRYGALERALLKDKDAICQQMGRVMASFQPGLFADVVKGGPLDLSRRDAEETVNQDVALTIVASRRADVFTPHPLDRGDSDLAPRREESKG